MDKRKKKKRKKKPKKKQKGNHLSHEQIKGLMASMAACDFNKLELAPEKIQNGLSYIFHIFCIAYICTNSNM